MNINPLQIIAAAQSEESADLLGMLGIDVQTLIFQMIAFLILVFVLGKWVYPVFVGIIDKREADIAASAKAADEAKKVADTANTEIAEMLQEARREAGEIVATAKTEAGAMVAAAESKAKAKSESIVAAAREDIEKEISDVRKSLHNEMVDLVTLATEKVVGQAAAKDVVDQKLIKQAVQGGSK